MRLKTKDERFRQHVWILLPAHPAQAINDVGLFQSVELAACLDVLEAQTLKLDWIERGRASGFSNHVDPDPRNHVADGAAARR